MVHCRSDLLMVTSFLHTGWPQRHPVFFACIEEGACEGIRESRSGSFALRERLFYMEDDALCKFYDALRKLCEKLHTPVQLSGILVPLYRRAY